MRRRRTRPSGQWLYDDQCASGALPTPTGSCQLFSRGCFESPVRCPRCPVRALGVPDESPRTGRTWGFGRCGESACRAPWVLCGTFETPPSAGALARLLRVGEQTGGGLLPGRLELRQQIRPVGCQIGLLAQVGAEVVQVVVT